ncbi:MAG: amidohydrolase [Henriciella sp.]|nr:amidohydrolase [Henriciella sp.]
MRYLIAALAGIGLTACQPADQSNSESQASAPAPELTVFTGGTIYTGLGDQTADAVTIDDTGRIVAVSPPGSMDWSEDEVTLIDLGGAVMFPGFVDGHAHLLGIGERELTLNLEGTASIGELVTRIESEVQGRPAGQVVFGRGWIETGWPEARMPSASDLDAVSPDNPVILTRADGHALVANTAALVAAGITDETPDVPGGKIERDADGKATGMLIDNAMGQAYALVSEPTPEDITRAFVVGSSAYAARGWTGVHNMSVNPRDAATMERLDLEGRMPLRLHNAYDREGFEIAANRAHETDTITNRSVKLYMDGALGSRGALLIEPYSDRPNTSGLSLMEPDLLAELMDRAANEDVQLAIHAIGDLANRRILDEYNTGGFPADLRWRIEHTQILHPDDITRVAELGLIASMQPSHAIGDLKFAPDRLGPNRLYGAYAWQTLLDTGAVVLGGSDAPVEIGTPQIEFYAAVARKDLQGFSNEDWYAEEALSREQALSLFTTAPAFGAFMEDELGTIEVGKLADFTVFDRDLMTIPEAEILQAQTVMTVVHGEIVYSAAE